MQKEPHAIDRHVGSRVRMCRLRIKMSQEKLAEALGLTFQQVQKYENGTNRMGASRLATIAKTLNVEVGFFFEGLPTTSTGGDRPDAMTDFMASADGIALTNASTRLPVKQRRNVVMMVETLANGHAEMQHRAQVA